MSVVGEFPVEGDRVTTDPTDDPGDDDDDDGSGTAVTLADSNLEDALRSSLGKPADAPILQSDLQGLTEITAENAGIQDLSGLENATSLETLDLGAVGTPNAVTDLSPLRGLNQLRELDLGGNAIVDLESLSGLGNLEILLLYRNRIADLSPLSGLDGLRELDLYSNRISDLSALSGLSNLTRLELGANRITDVSPLGGLTGLLFLDLAANEIAEVSPLGNLDQLRQLRLQQNRIETIDVLENLTALQDGAVVDGPGLNLAFNRIDLSDSSSAKAVVDLLKAIEALTVRTEPQRDPDFDARSVLKTARPLEGDWLFSDWLGLFNQKLGRWIFHRLHGWMYMRGEDESQGLWFHNGNLGWLWSREDTGGWFYSSTLGDWVFFETGGDGRRWMYRFSEKTWEPQPI